jgi:hypothetical protein
MMNRHGQIYQTALLAQRVIDAVVLDLDAEYENLVGTDDPQGAEVNRQRVANLMHQGTPIYLRYLAAMKYLQGVSIEGQSEYRGMDITGMVDEILLPAK